MKDFTQSIGFIIFVLCMVLGLDMVFGDQFAIMFLWLVLLSMLVINADTVSAFVKKYSSPTITSTTTSSSGGANW